MVVIVIAMGMVMSTVCRHKLEDGNCATDGYVERKVSDLVRENEELKAALEEERKRRDEIQREAMKENTKLALAAFSDKQRIREKILKAVEKLASKDDAVRQAPVLGQEGENFNDGPLIFSFPCFR